jgi:hypothetical protein
MKKNVEIICPSCKKETFLRREPVYDGLKKTGEKLFCVSCGSPFQDESEVSFKQKPASKVFGDEDKPKLIKVFSDEEANVRNCRRCAHYVVNPFSQKCGRTGRAVQATDQCWDFEEKPKPEAKKVESAGEDKKL